jgi:hypothetical protein
MRVRDEDRTPDGLPKDPTAYTIATWHPRGSHYQRLSGAPSSVAVARAKAWRTSRAIKVRREPDGGAAEAWPLRPAVSCRSDRRRRGARSPALRCGRAPARALEQAPSPSVAACDRARTGPLAVASCVERARVSCPTHRHDLAAAEPTGDASPRMGPSALFGDGCPHPRLASQGRRQALMGPNRTVTVTRQGQGPSARFAIRQPSWAPGGGRRAYSVESASHVGGPHAAGSLVVSDGAAPTVY